MSLIKTCPIHAMPDWTALDWIATVGQVVALALGVGTVLFTAATLIRGRV